MISSFLWCYQIPPKNFSQTLGSQANFVGYNDVVASALTAPSVGGSPECLSTYSKGHEELKEMMASAEGRTAGCPVVIQ